MKRDKPSLRDLLGLSDDIDFSRIRWLIQLVALAIVAIIVLLLFAFFKAIIGVGVLSDHEAQSVVIRNTGLAVAAVVGVPFLVWRSIVAQKQVDVAEQGHITERINKAVEGLGAEKTVSRVWRNVTYVLEDVTHTAFEGRDDGAEIPEGATDIEYGHWGVANRTRPNLEVRIGAIYALERIAQDSDRDHVQVMEILCAYIRQNAPDTLAEPFPKDWREAFAADDIDIEAMPSRRQIVDSARQLRKPREDIQVALTVLGRRSTRQIAIEGHRNSEGEWIGYLLDLRSTCLQNAYMIRGQFENARFNHAQMQGTVLSGARMQGADLSGAQMQGAVLREAQMQGAVLREARMQGAVLVEARMQGADLSGARMQGAVLLEARMQGADLRGARMQGADLSEAQMQGAVLSEAQMQGAVLLGAQMQGAALRWARMQGADLLEARMDASTDLSAATLRGAALRSVDFSDVSISQEQVDSLFGDQTVILPEGLTRPDWPEIDEHAWLLFKKQWRAWQKQIGFDLEDPRTWDAPLGEASSTTARDDEA